MAEQKRHGKGTKEGGRFAPADGGKSTPSDDKPKKAAPKEKQSPTGMKAVPPRKDQVEHDEAENHKVLLHKYQVAQKRYQNDVQNAKRFPGELTDKHLKDSTQKLRKAYSAYKSSLDRREKAKKGKGEGSQLEPPTGPGGKSGKRGKRKKDAEIAKSQKNVDRGVAQGKAIKAITRYGKWMDPREAKAMRSAVDSGNSGVLSTVMRRLEASPSPSAKMIYPHLKALHKQAKADEAKAAKRPKGAPKPASGPSVLSRNRNADTIRSRRQKDREQELALRKGIAPPRQIPGRPKFESWHKAIRSFDEGPTIPRNFKISNPEEGIWIVHDVPVFYECLRDGDHYDDAWMHRAFDNAKVAEKDGHLPPLHVHHRFRKDVTAFAAGTMRVKTLKKSSYKGRETLALFYDLIVTHEHIARELAANKLMWRSPEVSFEEARIVSLAMLDHEAPFFEGPMTTVEGDVPEAQGVPTFAWEPEPSSPVVAFSRSNGLTRVLIREDDMPYPIRPRQYEEDGKDEEEAKDVEQMADGGEDAPGGSAAPGDGEDAPGGTDEKKPSGASGGEKPAESKGDEAPTQMGDDDEDEDLDLEGLDEDLPDEGDVDPEPAELDDAGHPAGNQLLEALRATPATLEQALEALAFIQTLVEKMRGAQGGGQLPPPAEGPSDQMSDDQVKQFQRELAEQKGEIDGLKTAAEQRERDDAVTAFADESVLSFKGTTAGQRPNLHQELVAFAGEHGIDAAKAYVDGLRKTAVPVLDSRGGRNPLAAIAGDDVPDDLKPFMNEGPEAYEGAQRLYGNWQELRTKGFCKDIDFKTFADRERRPLTVPRHTD